MKHIGADAIRNVLLETLCIEKSIEMYALRNLLLMGVLRIVLGDSVNKWAAAKILSRLLKEGYVSKMRKSYKMVFYELVKPLEYKHVIKAVAEAYVLDKNATRARYTYTLHMANRSRWRIRYLGFFLRGTSRESFEDLGVKAYLLKPVKRELPVIPIDEIKLYRMLGMLGEEFDKEVEEEHESLIHRFFVRLPLPISPGDEYIIRLEYKWGFESNAIRYIYCAPTDELMLRINMPYTEAEDLCTYYVADFKPYDPFSAERPRGIGEPVIRRVGGKRVIATWHGPGPEPFMYRALFRRFPLGTVRVPEEPP